MSVAPSLLVLAAAGARFGRAADPDIPWLRIALAFLFCIALAVAAILLLRRYQGGRIDPATLLTGLVRPGPAATPRALRLEERLRLSATSQVLVLAWGGTSYLVHVGATGAQLIDRRPAGPVDGEVGQ